jgi:hypothetical protein
MAEQPLTLKKIYVVDTSYLLELFKVDGNYTDIAAAEIKKRFTQAENDEGLIFVPLPCIYELGNHIADVRDGNRRRELAHKVLATVEQCITKNIPWTITPATGTESLPELWNKFANEYITYTKSGNKKSPSIGLVDAATIHEAKRLKQEYEKRISQVHIWTKDGTLKSHEPDREPNPFIN